MLYVCNSHTYNMCFTWGIKVHNRLASVPNCAIWIHLQRPIPNYLVQTRIESLLHNGSNPGWGVKEWYCDNCSTNTFWWKPHVSPIVGFQFKLSTHPTSQNVCRQVAAIYLFVVLVWKITFMAVQSRMNPSQHYRGLRATAVLASLSWSSCHFKCKVWLQKWLLCAYKTHCWGLSH